MYTFFFQALGTEWSIMVDEATFPDQHVQSVRVWLDDFEARFSRFRPQSEVNAFRQALGGQYALSKDMLELLSRASELRRLTRGKYDPAVGSILEHAGYGMTPSVSHPSVHSREMSRWDLVGDELRIDGPTVFDLGGMGKGYAIDRVADILTSLGHPYYLVEGGGDMFGTRKADGSPWHIALEYPGQPELAAGTLELAHQGLAVSDRFRRQFGTWHHIVDVTTRAPVVGRDGCAAVAPSAWAADCMTSGLFLGDDAEYQVLARAWGSEYLVFLGGGRVLVSTDWPGLLFV